MSFFENLGKKITQVGEGAVEKTKQVTEIAKLSMKLDEEQRKLDKLYKQLGEAYSKAEITEVPAEFITYIDDINSSRNRISEIQNELDILKGHTRCPKCLAYVKKEDSFCAKCGTAIQKEVDEEKEVFSGDVIDEADVKETVETGNVNEKAFETGNVNEK